MYPVMRPHHIAPRLTTGAFMLNSGLRKLGADEQTEQGLHGMAADAYPIVNRMSPHQFTRLLASTEIALGAALLSPLVPTALAGAGLTTFATGLVGFYLRTPGTHQKGSPLPTDEGVPLAKDFWLLGIGLGFLSDRQAWVWPCPAACRRRRPCRHRRSCHHTKPCHHRK
ncbi:MAG: DoxX family membrane protein [Streptomyces sp.]|nr:DoxX family membrane protein [Streptomyces sp.]